MDHDFNPPHKSGNDVRRFPFKLKYGVLLALLVLLLLPLLLRPTVPSTEANFSVEEDPPPPILPPPAPEIQREILHGEIASGDTMTALLGDYFSPQEIYRLSQDSKEIFPLSRICAGQPFKICLADGEFERFEYDIDDEEQLFISRDGEDFTIERKPIPYTVSTDTISGVIESSLFEAVTASGESEALAMNLAEIFGWDIDFILDIRQGDSFQVLVEKRFRDGEPAGYGRILAAEFTNQDETFNAVLFQDGERKPDYYSLDGQSLRKAFLKAPLSFSRISSGFTMRRYHPIAKTWRAHPAIDYAAPTGTPIKTVGDGVVSQKGYTRGNGNYVKIRHHNGYETLYLHMKGFAKNLRKGGRVNQGQVIGYVGSTGLATGPHLCFRMRKHGAAVNPQKVKAPSVAPVSEQNLDKFRLYGKNLLDQLANRQVQVAQEQTSRVIPKN